MPASVVKKPDTVISSTTHRKLHDGKIEEFKRLVIPVIALGNSTPGCLYCSMAFDGDLAVIRAGYVNAEAFINHTVIAGASAGSALLGSSMYLPTLLNEISTPIRFDLIGPAAEIAKMKVATQSIAASDFPPEIFFFYDLFDGGFSTFYRAPHKSESS